MENRLVVKGGEVGCADLRRRLWLEICNISTPGKHARFLLDSPEIRLRDLHSSPRFSYMSPKTVRADGAAIRALRQKDGWNGSAKKQRAVVVARHLGEVGLVCGPSAILATTGHPALSGAYSAVAVLLTITLEFWLQRGRDRAFAAKPDVSPRDMIVHEAVKNGSFTPRNMDTYLRTTHVEARMDSTAATARGHIQGTRRRDQA